MSSGLAWLRVAAWFAAALSANAALGATCTSAGSGNWNAGGTWAAGCGAGGPVAGDTVIIVNPDTVTIPAGIAAAAASVAIGDTGSNGSKALTLAAATSSLTVSGAVTIENSNNNNTTVALNVNAGTVSMASLSVTGGAGNRVSQLAITAGSATVTGNISFAGTAANAQIIFSGAGTLNVGGALGNGGTLTAGTGTVQYNGGAAQTVNATYAYNNLTINKGGGSTATLGGNTTVGGNLTVTAGTLALSTFTANRTAAGGTLSVANGATLDIGGTNTFPANYNTDTLGATSTVDYSGTNQAVTAQTYGHLTLSGSGTKTPAAGTTAIAGNFTLESGVTYAGTTNNPVVNLAGNFSDSGTFNSGTGVFSFNGSAAQTLGGTSSNTTFSNLTINNTAAIATRTVTLSAGHDATVSGTLTFTSGRIVTGSTSKVVIPSGGSIAGAAGSPNDRFVAGRLQKFVAAGAPTVTFEVGTDGAAAPARGYSPATLTFAGVAAGGGSMLVSVGSPLGEHPSIGSSGLDPAKSVNRWWALTMTGVTGTALPAFTSFTATFTFIAGVTPAGDLDSGASTANFEIERWNGSAWNTTTVGARTGTTTRASGITALGEFAIAEKVPVVVVPGSFNAFETATAANAITGRVFTKRVSTNFAVDVVAILSGAQLASFTNTVQVDVVTGSTGGANCPGTPVTVAGTTQSVNLTAGRGTTGNFSVASAIPDARVRIRYPVASPTVISCSTDNFSIRPSSISVTSSNATNNGTSGTPTFATGANFNLTAATVAGYNGTPGIDNTAGMIIGSPYAGTIGGVFAAAAPGTGIATGNGFFYSEAGNFGLAANAVYDSAFTLVDQPADCTADFSNTLVGGKYGCSFGSSAIAMTPGSSGFGRFIPDNFNVAYNAPAFTTSCAAGSFSYLGQSLPYATAPQMTVTARSGTANGLTNSTARNYAGAYMKLSNAAATSLNQAPYATQSGRYARFDALGGGSTPALDTGALPATTADPVIGVFADGVGTLTFTSGLAFTRSTTTPSAPFNADIALSLNVIDTDGVVFAGNPARFGTASAGNGMGFTGGKATRFGRLRLGNPVGSEKLDLPVPLVAEYWSGTAFITNAQDNCTTLTAQNFVLYNHQGSLTPANMVPPTGAVAGNVSISGSFANGVSNLSLLKPSPTPGAPGSVDICVDLDVGPAMGDLTCQAPTPADKTVLRTQRTSPPGYAQDPIGRAAFGLYGSQPNNFIYFRENY